MRFLMKSIFLIVAFSFMPFSSASTDYSFDAPSHDLIWGRDFLNGKLRYLNDSNDQFWVGVVFDVPHYPQPTDNTCGASNLAMAKSWINFVDTGVMPQKPDIIQVYENANEGGASGLNANEMKNAIPQVIGLNPEEKGHNSVSEAIEEFVRITHLVSAYRPAPGIIYGNTINGGAGGHYYSIVGGINCRDRCDAPDGAFIHDSVYNSPAYKGRQPTSADYDNTFSYWADLIVWYFDAGPESESIAPGRFLTISELEKYWKPTGASTPWNRRHFYLAMTE